MRKRRRRDCDDAGTRSDDRRPFDDAGRSRHNGEVDGDDREINGDDREVNGDDRQVGRDECSRG